MASDFLDENWASIEGWPMEISSYGRVYSINAHKFLKPMYLRGTIGEDWYVLCRGSWHSVRRLVSRCFEIELPKNWEPMFDRTPRFRSSPYRGRVIHAESGAVFPNAKAAAEEFGVSRATVSNALRGVTSNPRLGFRKEQ